ncbi:MAG: hypothetical protein ACLGHL_06570 [Actinomycetota bacterium]
MSLDDRYVSRLVRQARDFVLLANGIDIKVSTPLTTLYHPAHWERLARLINGDIDEDPVLGELLMLAGGDRTVLVRAIEMCESSYDDDIGRQTAELLRKAEKSP